MTDCILSHQTSHHKHRSRHRHIPLAHSDHGEHIWTDHHGILHTSIINIHTPLGLDVFSWNTSQKKITINAWQSLAYSLLGVVVSPIANIYILKTPPILITPVPNSPTTSKRNWTQHSKLLAPYNFSRLKSQCHWTESYKISTQCTEINAD